MEALKRKWNDFGVKRKYPLTPKRIEAVTTYFEEEDATFNHKQDTHHFERQKVEDDMEMADNLNETGWPYNDEL